MRSILTVMVAMTATSAVATTSTEPQFLIGNIRGGATVEEVRKAYPKMALVEKSLGAASFTAEPLSRFAVDGVQVAGLPKPALVEFRFWNGKLWVAIVYVRGDGPAALEMLTKTLGPPDAGTAAAITTWTRKLTTTQLESKHGWYSVADNAMGKDAQAWFIANIKGGGAKSLKFSGSGVSSTLTAKATPQAAPAAAGAPVAAPPATAAAATPAK